MPGLRCFPAILCLYLSMALAAPVLAEEEAPVTAALRVMLATMPDLADAPGGGYQIDFGDVRAARHLLEATGATPFDPQERELAALMRGGTQIFVRSASAEDASFRAANGFGFADVETNLQYARPPIWLNVVSLGFGAGDAVAAGLPGAGFSSDERHAVPVFWRGEQDHAVMQQAPEDDLFGGAVRRSVRLALADDILAFSNAWAALDMVLTGDLPRMTEDRGVSILLDALDSAARADERLILASLFVDPLPEGYPPHLLVADLFGDDGHVTLIAMQPVEGPSAEDQRAQLQANLEGLPLNGAGASFAEIFEAEVDVDLIGDDLPVLVMRLVTAVDPDAHRLLVNRGYTGVQSLLMRRDFERLLSAPE